MSILNLLLLSFQTIYAIYKGGYLLQSVSEEKLAFFVVNFFFLCPYVSKTRQKPFAELSHVDLHRGIFDQWFGVGDIITISAQANPATLNGRRTSANAGISIDSIANYAEVYKLVKQLQEDIYTDVMYPNDLRPRENHGYKSKYRGQGFVWGCVLNALRETCLLFKE